MDDPVVPTGHPELELTGERTLPGIWHETYWFERHVVAYRLAAARVRRLGSPVVLDAGCGEGYGLAMLAAAGAERVVGVDLDADVVAHARARYAQHDPRIEVAVGDLAERSLADGEADLTVCFQVIEHLHDLTGALRALARATRPGGALLVTTPNRLTFTPGGAAPVNPFHTRELTARELALELRSAGLELTSLLGVHHGRRLRMVERATGHPLPERLTATPPEAWPRWLTTVVRRVDASWFRVRERDVDASLDLVASCRVPLR